MMFYEVSAKTGVNVNDMFLEIGEWALIFALLSSSSNNSPLRCCLTAHPCCCSQATAPEDRSAQASARGARQLGSLLLKFLQEEASNPCVFPANNADHCLVMYMMFVARLVL